MRIKEDCYSRFGRATLSSHYDVIDLTTIPDDYLPRTNYIPDCAGCLTHLSETLIFREIGIDPAR